MTKDELKKEAEEWVKDHSGLIGSYEYVKYDYDSLIQAYLASAEPREKRIAELEQENARLKLELEALNGQMPWKEIKDKSEVLGKLTKAKEIIKKLYSHVFLGMGFMEINGYNVQKAEAEQFLKEVE